VELTSPILIALPRANVAHTQVLNGAGRTRYDVVAITHRQAPGMSFWFKRSAR